MSADDIHQEIKELLNDRYSLELATSSLDGTPCASYAPFVCLDRLQLCVYLSTLARHTRNIEQNPKISVMIIEDEKGSANLFARKRLILECDAKRLERNSDDWNRSLLPYKNKFGAIVDTLVQLADFHLHLLIPNEGTYVKGFGQAYRLTGDDLSDVKHITNPAKDADDGNG